MRVAALDLGSNTSLLLIADLEGSRLERVVHDQTTVTRMGQGVHATRQLHPEALARLDACLADYRREMDRQHCDRVIAVATSAARDVGNGDALIRLGQKYGIPIHIISGQREAALTFRGAICDRPSSQGIAVVDVGGGSTEVIHEREGRPSGTSVDVGSVRLSEMFVAGDPIAPAELAKLANYATDAFARAALNPGPIGELVAVAGTPTTLAGLEQKVDFREDLIHGYKLTRQQLETWVERLAKLPLRERQALPGMQPKRADVIVAGTAILLAAVRALAQEQITVSTRGVRYGVALEWETF